MRRQRSSFLAVMVIAMGLASGVLAQGTILERQQAMFGRNVGTAEEQREQFPPHRIAGNLYFVGSKSLASHPAMYGMLEKHARLGRGGPNFVGGRGIPY